METVVMLIMLLVGLSFLLKLSFMRPLPMIAEAAVIALVAVGSTDAAALQSKSQIGEWLQSPGLMLDVAVLLTVDVAAQIAFCIVSVGGRGSLGMRILRGALLYFPGLLIFPVVFYLLVQLIFALTGTGFATVGYTLGASLLAGCPLVALGVRFLLPEPPLRLELIFDLNCIIALLGIIATVNGRTATVGVNEVSLPALGTIAALLLCGAAAGFFLYHRKINKQS